MKYRFLLFVFIITSVSNLFSQVNVEDLRRSIRKEGIRFQLGLDFTFKEGNTEEVKIEPNFQLDYKHHNFYTFLYLDGAYEESNYVLSDNNAKIHYRFVYNLTEVFYPELFLQSEYDQFIELKERDLIGGGMRFLLVNYDPDQDSTKNFGLSLGVGAMFEYEEINSDPDYYNRNGRLTSYLSFKWKPSDTFVCASTTYFQPKLNNWNDIKAYNESEFAFYIGEYFAFTFDLTWKYHSNPPPNVKEYDVELSNGIKVLL
jgi:hypothetical protein